MGSHHSKHQVLNEKLNEELKKPKFTNEKPLERNEQIEEWTGMKIGNIIFDSDVDNWSENTSDFDKKIINKSNMIFLIEGRDGNLFGGYVNAIIYKTDGFINDPKSFVFTFKSNKALKFDIAKEIYAFYLNNSSSYFLFSIGFDIMCYKEKGRHNSFYEPNSFKYNGIYNALCDQYYFHPEKLLVIQLI